MYNYNEDDFQFRISTIFPNIMDNIIMKSNLKEKSRINCIDLNLDHCSNFNPLFKNTNILIEEKILRTSMGNQVFIL